MPDLKSLVMLLLITAVGAGATLYISNKYKKEIDIMSAQATIVPPVTGSTTPAIEETPTAPQSGTTGTTPKAPVTQPQGIVPSLTGKLTEVNTGCFADGECYAVVDGKKVTLLIGWYQGKVGKILGADSIGDLEAFIGTDATVFAGQDADGNYSLLGNEMFYIQVSSTTKPVTAACVVGGCSSQLCGEAADMNDMVTTCEYQTKYSCYQKTTCARQATGKCGWTETPELLACLKDA